MKILALIFSLIMMALIATPCRDLAEDDIMHKTEAGKTTNNTDQHGTNHCSPFCTCDCCTSPVLNLIFVVDLVPSVILKFSHAEYHINFISSLFTAIWQPPKIN
jgi:hypothetical protein